MKTWIGTMAAVWTLGAGMVAGAVELRSSPDTVYFPFRADAVEVVAGKPLQKVEIQNGASITRGPLLFCHPVRSNKNQTILLKTNLEIPETVKRIGYWIRSRGSTWCEVNLLLQEPDGEVNLYSAPASGDSPWTFYEWEIQPRSAALRKFGTEANPEKSRKFKGILLKLLPFSDGGYRFGDVVFSSSGRPAPRTCAWTLRDVAEDLNYQSAFSGFRLAFGGSGPKAALPLVLFCQNPQAQRIRGMIYDSEGKVYDNFELNLEKVATLRQMELVLPLLPAGNYWIDLHLFDVAGALLERQKLSYLVLFSPENTPPATQMPALSALFPDEADPLVEVMPGGELKLKAKLLPGDLVHYTWFDPCKEKKGSGTVETRTIPVPEGIAIPAIIRLELALERGGKIIDRRIVRVRLPGEKTPERGTPRLPSEFFPLDETETISITQRTLKEGFAEHIPGNRSNWSICFYWSEIEPVRGQIQYPVIDRYLRLAERMGIKVTLTFFIHLDHLPQWLWYDQLLDQNGQNMHYSASFTRKFSPCSERTVAALCDTIGKLVKTYRNSPAVAGWNFSQGVESFWSDASRNGLVVGYDAATVGAFRNYLKEKKFPLSRIGADSYDAIEPPRPVFNGKPDLRPLYLEWEEFRQSVVNSYFARIFSAVRSAGATQPIKSYAGMGVGDISRMLAVYKQYGAELCFGGGDAPVHAFLQSQAMHAGVSLIGESFALPPFAPTLNFVMFTESAYGSMTGGTNIMWGRHFTPNPTRQEALEASRIAAKLTETIRGLGRSELVTANGALMFGMRSMVNVSRSTMWIDWANLNTNGFAEALNTVISNNLQMPFLTDSAPQEILNRQKIIVMNNSPILEDAAAGRLVAFVRQGGTLILMGETGRYDENGRESWTLRKLLGGEAASGREFRLGKGRVVWREKPIVWERELMPLLGANAFFRPLRPSNGMMRTALRKALGGEYHLYLFGKNWGSGNPHLAEVSGKNISARVEIHLPEEGNWSLTDVTAGKELGISSGEQLASGMNFTIRGGELKIVRMKKVQ